MLKALFIEGVARTSDPGNILTYINRGITQSLEGTGFFLTAVCLLIDTQASRVSIANAGHDNPIKIKDGKASQLGENAGQTIIGTFTDISFHSTPAPIEKGDLIILFTDGITEARNKEGEFYQKEKLISALIENISVPLESKINLIMQSTEHYSAPAPPADDRTLILVQIH
jgi:serine phosphatase RsbU (regulator of sigma subunit)